MPSQKTLSLILPLLFLAPLPTASDCGTANECLGEILQALSDDNNPGDSGIIYGETSEKADKVGKVAYPPSTAGATGISHYWSGASQYKSDGPIANILKVQVLLDAIVARPMEEELTVNLAKILFTAQRTLGSDIDADSLTKIFSFLNTNRPAYIETYRNAYILEQKVNSCIAYSDDRMPSSPNPPAFVYIDTAAKALEKSKTTLQACDKPKCDYEGIQSLKNKIVAITNDAGAMLEKANNAINELPVTINEDNIGQMRDLSGIIKPIQALIAKSFLDTLKSTETSFKCLYTDCNAEAVGATNTPPDLQTQALIDSIAGLETVSSPLAPGIPFMDGNVDNWFAEGQHWVLIAGKYYAFNYPADGAAAENFIQSVQTGPDLTKYVFASKAMLDAVLAARKDIEPNFNLLRKASLLQAQQSLLSKSSTIDVLGEMAALQSNGDLTTLQDASDWRLKDSDGWLNSVSTMSNVSLLRETAVLLAEMKQMMYLQFSYNQKQLLMQAVSSASSSPPPPGAYLSGNDLEKYAGGLTDPKLDQESVEQNMRKYNND
ncbi:hypothetical protein [Candidatus Synchoanobacter obligatus]|uniref:Uncharacterized protein n=1 Tax=Candidatus Synchoanobacter obligatus TaxID=2919597 RepID=A0ABT1L579_9GAMM|nr:hypothetical protein [Candidatus Synchoanobacter obligatus]MCP8352332.1 hypothetical protein [Candidatus Synchoanobacter obligatus]